MLAEHKSGNQPALQAAVHNRYHKKPLATSVFRGFGVVGNSKNFAGIYSCLPACRRSIRGTGFSREGAVTVTASSRLKPVPQLPYLSNA